MRRKLASSKLVVVLALLKWLRRAIEPDRTTRWEGRLYENVFVNCQGRRDSR